MLRFRGWILAVGMCLGLVAEVGAQVKLPSIFSDHMVLQRDKPIAVWGWDAPGTEVTVSLGDVKASAKANEKGKWQASLPAQKANAAGQTLAVQGTSAKKFTDVLVGEVWLCSGQSNMEWSVADSINPKEEIARGSHPLIRHIKIPHRPSDKPETDVPSRGWEAATPKTVGSFTAVGYFFAVNLRKDVDVPVGLIGSNWGGTRIEPWTTPEGFKSVPALKGIADKLDTFPTKDAKGNINMQTPLALYYGMIAPLVPYGIRGALWYQGESNNGEGMLYHEKMKALINGWRTLWNDEAMPFLFVQIAPYKYNSVHPNGFFEDPWRRYGPHHRYLRYQGYPSEEQAGGGAPAGADRPGQDLWQGRAGPRRPGLQSHARGVGRQGPHHLRRCRQWPEVA